MKTYKSITQDWAGQLLARYGVVDHSWNVEMDFDILTDYAVYPHETGAFIAEYLPATNCFWAYNTVEEACEAVLNKINEKKKADEERERLTNEFQEIINKNSLDERYRDMVKTPKKKEVKKMWYLENLAKQARERTEELHAQIEKARSERNWKLANAEYVYALLNH